ncbi:MAG: class I SAM-dependent methyltransferase [Candidatus Nanopelagicales bacterium]
MTDRTYERTADETIYTEDRYEEPKEKFVQVAEHLGLSDPPTRSAAKSLLDVGAATGEFLYYVRTINPEIPLRGVEYSEDLVEHARPTLEARNIALTQGDANDLAGIPEGAFDYVTCLGVTSIFDDFRPCF